MTALRLLVWHRLRRDRVQIPAWIGSFAALIVLAVVGLQDSFGSVAERTALISLAAANPAILFLRGAPQGTDVDAVLVFTLFSFLGILVGLMNTFLAVRHSRAEEDSGRAALIAATPAARWTPALSTLVYGLGVNLVLFVAVSGCFAVAGLDPAGSVVAGVALAATGVTFLAVGLVASELMPSARAANSVGVGVVLVSYLLRGLGDAFGTVSGDGVRVDSAWPAWLSPIGWANRTRPFTENALAPLLVSLAVAAVLLGVAALLLARRDAGASVVAVGIGRPAARRSLAGPVGLAWRLQWPSIVTWAAGGAVFGIFGGALAPALDDGTLGGSVISDELTRLTGGADLAEAFTTVIFSLVGILAAAGGIQAIIRLRQEEAGETGALMLATPLSRLGWLGSYLIVATVAVLAVVTAGALASVVAAFVVGVRENSAHAVLAAAVQVPAALLFLGAAALAWALVPRFTAGIAWGGLGLAMFLGIFGPLVGLPDWAVDLSPFRHSPEPQGTDTDWSAGIVMVMLALVTGAAASVFFRRRDLAGG